MGLKKDKCDIDDVSVSFKPTNNLRYKKRQFTTSFGEDTISMLQQEWKAKDNSTEWRWVEMID